MVIGCEFGHVQGLRPRSRLLRRHGREAVLLDGRYLHAGVGERLAAEGLRREPARQHAVLELLRRHRLCRLPAAVGLERQELPQRASRRGRHLHRQRSLRPEARLRRLPREVPDDRLLGHGDGLVREGCLRGAASARLLRRGERRGVQGGRHRLQRRHLARSTGGSRSAPTRTP
jgi:hypothetical protein